ncbi:hypothetical protein GCM10007855_39600 [Aliivibrio sifiae]|nr:hypothetical protein GCM10007855_39600 [Aliivibrio sifiae]
MNDGLHVNNEHDLVQIQNTIAQYQQQANKEIESLEHKVSQQDAIITLPQTRQLKQFIHQLNIQSSRILSIQKNILSLSSIIKEKQPSLRYGLSSIGPEMNRISAFLITNNSEADDASNRFVSSSMALETTFLTLMAESDPSTAKKWYREIYNRISALELAYDDLSALYPELTSYMSLSAPLDMVMSEIKHDDSIPNLQLTTLSLLQEQQTLILAALNGLTVIDNNNQRLTQLNEALSQNVIAMDTLDSQVEKIQSMVGVIASLAENTNLLALNAAIEAARAGEQGRGFAVVADEVRQLAGSTSKQTQHIRETMNALLKAANETKASISFSQTEMALALESSLDVSATFKLISETVTHISDRISQVSVATEEQAQAASEVNSNINSINQYGVKIELQLNAFVESTEEVAGIASQQKELIARYHL